MAMPDDHPTAELPVITVDVPPTPAPEATPAPARPTVSHAAPRRRRRRWPWAVLGVVVGLLIAGAAAALWYLSGLIAAGSAIPQPEAGFPMTVTAVDGAQVAYRGVPSGWTDQGLAGLASIEGGYAQTVDPVVAGSGTGARTITGTVLTPELQAGQSAALDGWYFPRDPRVGLGLDFDDVTYDAPLGPTPAWFIPGTSSTWVIVVHGRGDAPRQGLRIASTTAAEGYPTLLIRYRNDAGAPLGTGYAQWGAAEWEDVDAAVQYALDNGATKVVLAGISLGGSAALAFLQNSDQADAVVGVFLDAPATDYGAMVQAEATERGVPSIVTDLAQRVAAWRFGFDWDAIDYVTEAGGFDTPMLVVQGTADTSVPAELNERFAAAAAPGVVTLELFDGAGHTTAWNTDRPRYEQLLADFLSRVAPAP